MEHQDIQRLVQLLTKNALTAPMKVGVEGYFHGLVMEANLPPSFQAQRAGGWTGAASNDALELVNWALARGVNPADPRYTTLGSILEPELDRSGLNIAATIAALIVTYKLYRDPALLEALGTRYQIPRPSQVEQVVESGPDIDWRGPSDPVELQSWFRPEPDLLDVGFLIQAINKAASICRVEVGNVFRGTGFLIDPNLVLTNYHVLGMSDGEVVSSASQTVLRFGVFTSPEGKPDAGQKVNLHPDKPLVAFSSEKVHDFALLRVSDQIYGLKDIAPASFTTNQPGLHSGLNILQHPEGETMKLAISSNGVTGAYEDTGYLQYVSRVLHGSSGSPCFNDNWNVVAIHHAARSRFTGIVGEGILMKAIYTKIKQYLNTQPV